MAFSPVRDVAGALVGIAVILLIPLALSSFVFRVTSVPLTADFQLSMSGGDLAQAYFVSILGMSQLWFNTLATQLGVTSLLSEAFAVVTADWVILSIAVFALCGVIAAFVLKSDVERLIVPIVVGLGALLLGVLFVEGFLRGLTGLEDFTRMSISNALNVLIVISYGVGAIISGGVSLGLGRLVSGRGRATATAGAFGPMASARGPTRGEASTFKEGEEKMRAEEKPTAKQVAEEEHPEAAEATPTVTAVAEPEAREPKKAISASEKVETAAFEDILKQVEAQRAESVQAEASAPSPEEKAPTPSEVERELAEKAERAKTSKELFAALEAPLDKMASRVEKEPGAVWRPIPCPVCGSELTWSRERQAYVCPYCGTVP